jgi:hypothetical protein
MSATRPTLEEVLEQARRLTTEEQQRLVADLQRGSVPAVSEERRRAALARFLARSGTAHSDYTDVSANKNAHLAEITATKP